MKISSASIFIFPGMEFSFLVDCFVINCISVCCKTSLGEETSALLIVIFLIKKGGNSPSGKRPAGRLFRSLF